ncbi:MAG: patatin-like phospholipase family protein [Alphaproteobacteria bacterium]|nr:patatin-like phospholipase family protein [Alphaproteobacteria bacterium]
MCFSGGGNRSAAFAIGVMRALHERDLLGKIDVISAVSGGTYALSWFLLQPIYHRANNEISPTKLREIQDEMFDLDGPFQRYLVDNAKPLGATNWISLLLQMAVTLPFDFVLFNALRIFSLPLAGGSRAANFTNLLNAQSMSRKSYRDGIQRSYHVFPDLKNKAPVEKLGFWEKSFAASEHLALTRADVPPVSFPALTEFAQRAKLPSFVFNTTVRPPRPDSRIPLGQRIFEIGPMGLGSNSCGYLAWDNTEGLGWEPSAPVEPGWMFRAFRRAANRERPTSAVSPFATIRNVNVAPAVSGAALSGTNIEGTRIRWLLQLFNLGLEYVVPSPADNYRAVRLSDGGHSENLGAFALLRRRCSTIIVVDAEHDPSYQFGAYRTLKQAAKRELGIKIEVPGLDGILDKSAEFKADTPIHEGTTTFDDNHRGKIYYLKLSKHAALLGDQAPIIDAYAEHHHRFPQEPTSDQYFEAPQFEAYRALGCAIARTLPADVAGQPT